MFKSVTSSNNSSRCDDTHRTTVERIQSIQLSLTQQRAVKQGDPIPHTQVFQIHTSIIFE